MPKAYASAVVDAPADQVWSLLRDFNGMPAWNPGVADSAIEAGRPSDAVGCIRSFTLRDGAQLRERLLSLSDTERSLSYDFQQHPFPVSGYQATLRVAPVTASGASFVEWWTTFDCEPGLADQMVRTFATEVFSNGLAGLQAHFA